MSESEDSNTSDQQYTVVDQVNYDDDSRSRRSTYARFYHILNHYTSFIQVDEALKARNLSSSKNMNRKKTPMPIAQADTRRTKIIKNQAKRNATIEALRKRSQRKSPNITIQTRKYH